MLMDNESIVSVILLSIVKRLQKLVEDLIHIKVSITSFAREIMRSLKVLPIELIKGTQTTSTVFFVLEFSSSYNALLGRDWILSNCCLFSITRRARLKTQDGVTTLVFIQKSKKIKKKKKNLFGKSIDFL